MEKLLESDAPLFGRMTRKLYVRPLQYTQIESFTRRYDAEKRLAQCPVRLPRIARTPACRTAAHSARRIAL